MHRRNFLGLGLAGATFLGASRAGNDCVLADERQLPGGRPFTLKLAPHFGMFRNSAPGGQIDELKFAADQGFQAWEDNAMKGRPVALQREIASTMQRLDMRMGVISASAGMQAGPTFSSDDETVRDGVLQVMRQTVEVAQRVNAKWMTVVPGDLHDRLPLDYQMANSIELLKRCCDIVEPHGLVMVIEPLNPLTDHPGEFLSKSPQAYLICRAVNRPSCKILFDIYHQQITEGNLIANIDHCWDEIGYFQVGDNPGRAEPGTGEINYANVFRHIHEKGYQGIVGLEHSNSKQGIEGEQAVIAAYRRVDPQQERE
jgi:hydroxypyruvate isomerase